MTKRHPNRSAMRMTQIGAPMRNAPAMRTSQIRSSQRGIGKALIVALFLLLPAAVSAQGTLAPVPQQVFLDSSGNPLNNGKICTYAAGTTTPLATYYDPSLNVLYQNANPIRTNSAGRPTTGGVYLSATSYKIVVLTAGSDGTCSTGTTIYSQDNVASVPATAVGLDIDGTAGEALAAGDAVYLSDGSGARTAGRWYKADADNTYSSSGSVMVGMAPTACTSGQANCSIRVGGRMTGLSGLTVGTPYYASATAGALTSTAPTNARLLGSADTTTSIVIAPNPGPTWAMLAVTGNTALGDAAADTLTVNATITSNLIATDNTYDIGASGATRFRNLFLAGNATIGGTLALTGVGTFTAQPSFLSTALHADDIIWSANKVLRRNTSDGSDSGSITLAGGGAAGSTRGAYAIFYGNEFSGAGFTGIDMYPGNIAGSKIILRNGADGNAFNVNFDGTVESGGIQATTCAACGSAVRIDANVLKRDSSSLAFKDWRPLTLDDARNVLRLTPIAFTSKIAADHPGWVQYGFGAEPTYATHQPFGIPDQSNYNDRAILAASTRVVQEHDVRLDKQLDLIDGLLKRMEALEQENAALRAQLWHAR